MRQTHHWAALVFVAAIVIHLCRCSSPAPSAAPARSTGSSASLMLFLALGRASPATRSPTTCCQRHRPAHLLRRHLGHPGDGTLGHLSPVRGRVPGPRHHLAAVRVLHHAAPGPAAGPGRGPPGHPGPAEAHPVPRPRPQTSATWSASVPSPSRPSSRCRCCCSPPPFWPCSAASPRSTPVWQYGPFRAVQRDLAGPARPLVHRLPRRALRLGPPWDLNLLGFTISEVFWPAVLFPGIAFGIWPCGRGSSGASPGTGPSTTCLDRPRDTPVRTGIGAAGLMVFLHHVPGGRQPIFGVLLGVPVETIIRILQWRTPGHPGPVVVGLRLSLPRICQGASAAPAPPPCPDRATPA